MKLQRRHFVSLGGLALGAAALPFLFRAKRSAHATGLVPDPDGILDLPPGFTYRVLQRVGEPMSDGYRVPSLPDGMACFGAADGKLVLLRNHEVTRSFGHGAYSSGHAPAEAVDPTAFGGVTRLVVDARSLDVASSNLVLTGTLKTCAGGPTPWGWLACEENAEDGHGYVFLCRPDAERVRRPERIDAYGRFTHEAVAFDPATNIAYLTEDQADSCFYRFSPDSRDKPFSGKLQALAVTGQRALDTSSGLSPGQKLAVEWLDVPERDPNEDSVRHQACELGAATFRRGEGAFFGNASAYFVTTAGGASQRGQVFRLAPGQPDTLELVAEARDQDLLDCPDNITVAPFGDVIIAEDGPGDNFLRGLTQDGKIYDIARNAASSYEMSGLCFSPDGGTLFVNLQVDGITLAVRGPFTTLGRSARSLG